MIDELIKEWTGNPQVTLSLHKELVKDAKILNEIREENPDLPLALIAGGSVRDAFFGRPFRDVDIFIDFPEGTLEEDQHDILTYYTGRYTEKVAAEENIPKEEYFFKGDNTGYEGDVDGEHMKYLVYETIAGGWDRCPRQFVSRVGANIEENPFVFVEKDFDWPLVKAILHPDSLKLGLGDSFVRSLEQKTINIAGCDNKTHRRALNWWYNNMAVSAKLKIVR